MQCGIVTFPASQELQQTAMFHQLCHDEDGLLHRAHCIELQEVGMSQSLHHLGLLDEIIHLHRACVCGKEGKKGRGGGRGQHKDEWGMMMMADKEEDQRVRVDCFSPQNKSKH